MSAMIHYGLYVATRVVWAKDSAEHEVLKNLGYVLSEKTTRCTIHGDTSVWVYVRVTSTEAGNFATALKGDTRGATS